jgi:hypothetical protein
LHPRPLDLAGRFASGVEGQAIVRHQSVNQFSAVAGEEPSPHGLGGLAAAAETRLAPGVSASAGRPPSVAKPALKLRIFDPPDLSDAHTGKLASA